MFLYTVKISFKYFDFVYFYVFIHCSVCRQPKKTSFFKYNNRIEKLKRENIGRSTEYRHILKLQHLFFLQFVAPQFFVIRVKVRDLIHLTSLNSIAAWMLKKKRYFTPQSFVFYFHSTDFLAHPRIWNFFPIFLWKLRNIFTMKGIVVVCEYIL